jgi:hypothetical protein
MSRRLSSCRMSAEPHMTEDLCSTYALLHYRSDDKPRPAG